ncbi:MAG: DUF3108 domain-containing protein [Candidatus Kapabacteria bacterium]|nr:DUF3108 domain-containing protein [Candidatus Kapabacteria bacterium]
MNKKINISSLGFIAALFVASFFFLGLSDSHVKNKNKQDDKTATDLRYLKNEAYGFGERLDYKVGYKFITAGYGSFEIMPKPLIIFGRNCYNIQFEVHSLPSLEFLYKVRDRYSSAVDCGGIFPWAFEQHIREGKYSLDFRADFDHWNNYVKANNKYYPIPKYTHDVVSAFFYVRTLNLSSMRTDSVLVLKNFFGDTTYSLAVKIKGKEEIEVEAGKFRCIVIEPIMTKGGLFKNEGNIRIWLSDDDRKIPVKVASKILIGYVGAELTKYSGLRGPLTAKLD